MRVLAPCATTRPVSEEIRAAALAAGVRPSTLRRALEAGDAGLVAGVLGVDRLELERRLAELARAGVDPGRVASVAVLGA